MTTRPVVVIWLLLAATLTLGGCSTHLGMPAGERPPVKGDYSLERVIENIVYTQAGWPQALAGDLYLPARRGPLPVVMTIHGGGWTSRSRADMAGLARKLVRHGYAVFNISYRFSPRFTYPAQRQDLEQALAWLAANARQYRLDLDRISTWGYSSGAHLAALIGGYNFPQQSGPGRSPTIRAVVAGGTPADLRKYQRSPLVMRLMGGDLDEMPERYADASPAWHVDGGDPPVFLYHGKLDLLVTTDQPIDYYEALQDAGVDAELYLQGFRGHSTMFLFGDTAENLAIAFLNRINRAGTDAAAGTEQ